MAGPNSEYDYETDFPEAILQQSGAESAGTAPEGAAEGPAAAEWKDPEKWVDPWGREQAGKANYFGSMMGAGEEAQRQYGGAIPGGPASPGVPDTGRPGSLRPEDDAYWAKVFAEMGASKGGAAKSGVGGAALPTSEPPQSNIKMPNRTPSRGGSVIGTPALYTPEPFKPTEFKYTGPEQALPEYKPPEEDKNFARQKRSEFSALGNRRLERQASQAMLTGRNINNPAARQQFTKNLLAGYGEGLSSVMNEAGHAAAVEAQRKRSDELHTYASQWSANAEMARTKYQREFQTQLQNYLTGQQAAQAGVNERNRAQMINMGRSGAIPSSAYKLM